MMRRGHLSMLSLDEAGIFSLEIFPEVTTSACFKDLMRFFKNFRKNDKKCEKMTKISSEMQTNY